MIASAEPYPRLLQFPIGFDRIAPAFAPDYIGGAEVRDVLNGSRITLPAASSVPTTAPTTNPVNQGLVGTTFYPLVCMIENHGDVDLVGSVKQSNDNGLADVFAALNLRYNGAAVTSITVKPGCRALFTIETLTKRYAAPHVVRTLGGLGRFSLWHFTGILVPTVRAFG